MNNDDTPKLTVENLLEDNSHHFRLKLIAGRRGLTRPVSDQNLHRPGLALSGYYKNFPAERLQLLGNTETSYLLEIGAEKRRTSLEKLFSYPLTCVLITDGNDVLPEIVELSEIHNIPIITTDLTTTGLSFQLTNYLSNRLAETIRIHGTLVDVYGTGLLLVGRPRIGKSEIALDLVERGHRLVADDIVELTRRSPDVMIGSSTDLLRHMIEIRGVGVINVRNMFGVKSIRVQKRVETVVELTDWDDKEDYERLGLDEQYTENYLGMKIPLVRLPIFPGKNITVIAEAIALNLHLKIYGENAAQELSDRQRASMEKKVKRIRDYLEWDNE